MKLIPYKNVFEFDIPNRPEYFDWKKGELKAFRDRLLSEPDTSTDFFDDMGNFRTERGTTFPYWRDIVSVFHNSRWIGFPHYVTPKSVTPADAVKCDMPRDLLDNWTKFAHYIIPPEQTIIDNEINSWTYSEGSIRSTINSTGYIGLISDEHYTDYYLDVKMKSDAKDNDRMAVIVAYLKDSSGKEHTLSAIRNNDNKKFTWRLVYNYNTPSSWVIDDRSSSINTDALNWDNYPNGTRIKVRRTIDKVTVSTTQNDSDVFVPEATIHIDLKADKRTQLFMDKCSYGLGCHSQALVTFEDMNFVEYGNPFSYYQNKNITCLLRGDNFGGRQILGKMMTRLDYNAMLIEDNNDYIGTLFPMFRCIVVGYYVSGITNGGTDLMNVSSLQDVLNVLGKLYSTPEFYDYNILIDGDIVQPYINHVYLEHIYLKQKYESNREWLDMYCLPQQFINRMNDRVSEEFFKMWGYAKQPYTLPNYPTNTDWMLYQTSLHRDSEILSHDLGDAPLSKYPSTVSLPRADVNQMLISLIIGSGVRPIKHYKTKPPIPCNKPLNHLAYYDDEGLQWVDGERIVRKLPDNWWNKLKGNNTSIITENVNISRPHMPIMIRTKAVNQSIIDENVLLKTQQDMGSCATGYPESFYGRDIICSDVPYDQSFLSSALSIVAGKFIWQSKGYKDYKAFENLQIVFGLMAITDEYKSLLGFDNLIETGGLIVTDISQLSYGRPLSENDLEPSVLASYRANNITWKDFDYMNKLKRVKGDLQIGTDVTGISYDSISGLRSLERIDGTLHISGPTVYVPGLYNLKYVGGNIDIGGITYFSPTGSSKSYKSVLRDLTPLSSIEYLGGVVNFTWTTSGTSTLTQNYEDVYYEWFTENNGIKLPNDCYLCREGKISARFCEDTSDRRVAIQRGNTTSELPSMTKVAFYQGDNIYGHSAYIHQSLTYHKIESYEARKNYFLRKVDGSITLTDLRVTNMFGFNNLAEVTGNIEFLGSNTMNAIGWMKSLKTVGGDIVLQTLPYIMNFYGMNSLETVGSITLDDMYSFRDFTGLESLKTINGDLSLSKCRYWRTMNGLDNLVTVKGNINLSYEVLNSLYGFKNLREVYGDINLEADPVTNEAVDIGMLANLSKLTGNLNIKSNTVIIKVKLPSDCLICANRQFTGIDYDDLCRPV
jgi:hypothetical protein